MTKQNLDNNELEDIMREIEELENQSAATPTASVEHDDNVEMASESLGEESVEEEVNDLMAEAEAEIESDGLAVEAEAPVAMAETELSDNELDDIVEQELNELNKIEEIASSEDAQEASEEDEELGSMIEDVLSCSSTEDNVTKLQQDIDNEVQELLNDAGVNDIPDTLAEERPVEEEAIETTASEDNPEETSVDEAPMAEVIPMSQNSNPSSAPCKMDLSIDGTMNVNLHFNVSGQIVSLRVSEENGLEIGMDGGAKFTIPLNNADSAKKAA